MLTIDTEALKSIAFLLFRCCVLSNVYCFFGFSLQEKQSVSKTNFTLKECPESWGFDSNEDVDCGCLGCHTIKSCRWLLVIQKNILLMLLQNIGNHLQNYTSSQPRRPQSANKTLFFKRKIEIKISLEVFHKINLFVKFAVFWVIALWKPEIL